MTTAKKFDQVDFIMDLEDGKLQKEQVVAGFQELINSGVVWSLQGTYGQTAQLLIEAGDCSNPTPDKKPASSSVGPYVNVVRDEKRTVGSEEYRILLYGAYNAMGLIGSECNGIAVLSEARMNVVADEIGVERSWNGVDAHTIQKAKFNAVMAMPDVEFVEMVNNSPRNRYQIDAPKKKNSLRPNG